MGEYLYIYSRWAPSSKSRTQKIIFSHTRFAHIADQLLLWSSSWLDSEAGGVCGFIREALAYSRPPQKNLTIKYKVGKHRPKQVHQKYEIQEKTRKNGKKMQGKKSMVPVGMATCEVRKKKIWKRDMF